MSGVYRETADESIWLMIVKIPRIMAYESRIVIRPTRDQTIPRFPLSILSSLPKAKM